MKSVWYQTGLTKAWLRFLQFLLPYTSLALKAAVSVNVGA